MSKSNEELAKRRIEDLYLQKVKGEKIEQLKLPSTPFSAAKLRRLPVSKGFRKRFEIKSKKKQKEEADSEPKLEIPKEPVIHTICYDCERFNECQFPNSRNSRKLKSCGMKIKRKKHGK